jgi:methyl-accepting chemotaxis protein
VAGAAEQAGAVASASEQLRASVEEIARSAVSATDVAGDAVEKAARTSATVRRLGDASTEIDEVVLLIRSVAEQTNLLALNATIEAARAGEAGKGFAVVATEVKQLAEQTRSATVTISERIAAIQRETGDAVDAIDEVSEVIGRISDLAGGVAAAVEQQRLTTAEVAAAIAGVSGAAVATRASAEQTLGSAQDLQVLAGELQHLVTRFRDVPRA